MIGNLSFDAREIESITPLKQCYKTTPCHHACELVLKNGGKRGVLLYKEEIQQIVQINPEIKFIADKHLKNHLTRKRYLSVSVQAEIGVGK